MRLKFALFVIFFVVSSTWAQGQPTPITSLLARAWTEDFDESRGAISGSDLVFLRAAQAARQGHFNDAQRLIEEIDQEEYSSQRNKLLSLLFKRIILDQQFSLVGGGYGDQRRLEMIRIERAPDEEALQSLTASMIERFPETDKNDARLANQFKLILDDCQSFALSIIRSASAGIPVPSGMTDSCTVIQESTSDKISTPIEQQIIQKVALAGLAAGREDIGAAQGYLTEGRAAVIQAHQQRSEAEFDLRLGDVLAMPHGNWETLGYDLGSDGLARVVLDAGALPKSRTYPSSQMLSEAGRWYSSASDLANHLSSPELSSEVRFRMGCLAFVQGDIRAAIPLFAGAGALANEAGSERLGMISLGISAILSANRTLYTKALHSLWLEGDVGGAGSLIEIAASYAWTLKFYGDTRAAIDLTLIVLNSIRDENVPLAQDMLMTNLISLYRINGDPDLQLYWANAAVEDENKFITEASKYYINPWFLDGENTHLATLLWNVEVELYARTLTELDDDKFWTNQLTDVERRIFSRDSTPQAQLTSNTYRQMKADIGERIIFARRVSHIASCESSGYESLRDELLQKNESNLLQDLDKYLAQCGDTNANQAALERLHSADIASYLTTLRNSSRRTTLTEQRDFLRANNELSLTMDTAVALQDFPFLSRWLDEIESSQGVTPKSYLTRLGMLLGTRQPAIVRDRVMHFLSDENAWKRADNHTRVGSLGALVEAYAQMGDSEKSLSALLNLWRVQASMNRTYSSALTTAELRRATLLRTPYERLSSQEREELLRLCLIDDTSSVAASSTIDISHLVSTIPDGVTVLIYFIGNRSWLWRLERGIPLKLIPLRPTREFASSAIKLESKFASVSAVDGWQEYSTLLYHSLVEPAGEFRSGQTLAIVGAGYFRGLPFDVLGASPSKLLGMQHPIVYIDRLLDTASSSGPTPRRSVVIGAGGLSSDQAEPEAEDIAALLSVKPLVGPDAVKTQIASALIGATWVHFSTHGVIDSQNPYRSYLTLSGGGRIQGFELPSLLKSASQVAFSACDSNAAFAPIGEDAHPGFSRGLTLFAHWAGTRWVVSSLWKADDAAARKLMVKYYEQLLKGDSNPSALFKAKLVYIEQEKQQSRLAPWYWAGFTVSAMALSDLSASTAR